MFEEQAKQELFETIKAFHASKQDDGQSVSSYLLKMNIYLDTLERIRFLMLNEFGTIAELHAKLKIHKKGIPKKDTTLDVLAIRGGKIHKDKKKLQGEKGKDNRKTKLAFDPKAKISPPPKRDNRQKTRSATTTRRVLGGGKLKHKALNLYYNKLQRVKTNSSTHAYPSRKPDTPDNQIATLAIMSNHIGLEDVESDLTANIDVLMFVMIGGIGLKMGEHLKGLEASSAPYK
nr:hypothetical protein [Tanacetum cinerariifolium]